MLLPKAYSHLGIIRHADYPPATELLNLHIIKSHGEYFSAYGV